jgi:uracil-DNA glycosylase family 4
MLHEDWYSGYKQMVWGCEACTARRECKKPVPGEGDLESPFIVVGRNPGRNEDAENRPFVGPGGEVLDRFLSLCGVSRQKGCFITNMCLCKTVKDRFLSVDEIKTCVRKFLRPTLADLSPKVVLVLGTQANYFINSIKKPSHHHGEVFKHKMGFHSICSLHPATVCYNPDLWIRFETLAPIVRSVLDGYKVS